MKSEQLAVLTMSLESIIIYTYNIYKNYQNMYESEMADQRL